MTLAQVKQRLHVKFTGQRFGNEVIGAVCGGGLRGEADFRVRSGAARLSGIAFAGGVRTKEGIAPGSTFRQLRRAYGRRLILDNDPETGDTYFVRSTRRGTYGLVFMVRDGRVVSIGLEKGGVLDVRCPTVSTPPPATIGVLSLTGASGLRPVMPERELLAAWPWFPLLTDQAGSGWHQWMPICAGATRGRLEIKGGALGGVWLSSGASTDAGISIGSTLDDLRRAYGADLDDSSGGSHYFVYAPGPPPVATLGFRVDRGIVKAIGFGGRQGIGGPPGSSVWC
jgi:hypothetical protein